MKSLVTIAAVAVAMLAATPALASSVRATGNVLIHRGPGDQYRVVGVLPHGTRVELSQCTKQSQWCKIVYDDGPDGWVFGPAVVGQAAKINVTPGESISSFADDFFKANHPELGR